MVNSRQMIVSERNKALLYTAFALLALIAGAYHFINLFYHFDKSPAWRHLLFVVVSLFCCYGFLRRPKYFILFFVFLSFQQSYSHGSYLVSRWQKQHQLDWISLSILIILPAILWVLIADYGTAHGRGDGPIAPGEQKH